MVSKSQQKIIQLKQKNIDQSLDLCAEAKGSE